MCGWAAAGIPLRVVERAIDRRYVRYHAKGPKRRPLRIEYLRGRRARPVRRVEASGGSEHGGGYGGGAVGRAAGRGGGDGRAGARIAEQTFPLAAHLDDLAVRLSAWHAPPGAAALESVLKDARAAVEALRAGGRTLRGEARRRALDRLAELDRRLPAAARDDAGDDVLRDLRAEAQRSLEAFRSRMAAAAFASALDAATRPVARRALQACRD